MFNIFNFLKPDPFIQEISDQEEVKKKYKYWRIRILYSMFIGYALYYFTRKSFTFAMPGLVEDLGFEKTDLGLLGSIFAVTYGISKFASGVLADRSNPRYFMAIGLLLTGVFNIFFGFSSSLVMFALFWGLNGWFQGFGWPPCARFLTHWYSQSERGSWWAIWNMSHNVGAFLIPWIVGLLMHYFNWRYALYLPGVICIIGSLFLINRLRDTPQSLGLPSIEKFRNDYPDRHHPINQERELSAKEILVECVLKNRYIWLLALAYFFVYVVRTGINDWTALYLREVKEYSRLGASGNVSFFEVGGIFGSLFAGWSSDRLFQANRGPVNVLFSIGIFLSVGVLWMIPAGYPILDACAIFMIGFTVFGPQMLIGMAAAELASKKAAATATGFAGYFAYMGAAMAGYPVGAVTQYVGWDGFFWFMLVCSAIATGFLLPMWRRKAPELVLAS